MLSAKKPYQPPTLESQPKYSLAVGVSLPVGTNSLPNIEILELQKAQR
jgi:hypothetical protein